MTNTKQLHGDCISDILEEGNNFVTVGYDGIVNFLDKRNYGVYKTVDLESPLRQVVRFGDLYYIAGS